MKEATKTAEFLLLLIRSTLFAFLCIGCHDPDSHLGIDVHQLVPSLPPDIAPELSPNLRLIHLHLRHGVNGARQGVINVTMESYLLQFFNQSGISSILTSSIYPFSEWSLNFKSRSVENPLSLPSKLSGVAGLVTDDFHNSAC